MNIWNCTKCNEEIEEQFDACWSCGYENSGEKSLKVVPDVKEVDSKKDISEDEIFDSKEIEKANSTVIVTTGDLKTDYRVKECVFSLGSDSSLFAVKFKPSPDIAFKKAELKLKVKAYKLGCNAVINAQFEHRITVNKSALGGAVGNLTGIKGLGHNQGIEVFAYGTAVIANLVNKK